jgi:hypothetical protein
LFYSIPPAQFKTLALLARTVLMGGWGLSAG